jgi:hypothetical protein
MEGGKPFPALPEYEVRIPVNQQAELLQIAAARCLENFPDIRVSLVTRSKTD